MPPIDHRARRTRFVGRARELREIARWRAEDAWLATLVGPPGAGKTRLAHQAMGEHALWVDLHGATDDDVLGRIASAATLASSDVAAVARMLRERVDVLVLDECETAIAGVTRVLQALSERVPSLRVMATSRTTLGLAGERVITLGQLDPRDAGKLLVDRARARRSSFELSQGDESALDAVVACFGDLPLAIELVAVHVADLGVRAVAARLGEPLAWLEGARPDDRRPSLVRALAQSLASLSPPARAALAQLAALDRPFDLDDAAMLSGAHAVAHVQELMDHAWIASREGALDLLPPVRAFVRARSEPIDEDAIDRALLAGALRDRVGSLDRLAEASARRAEPAALERAYLRFAAAGKLPELAAAAAHAPELAARAYIECGRFEDAEVALGRLADRPREAALLRARMDFRRGNYDRLAQLSLPEGPWPVAHVEVLATAASIRGEVDRAVAIYDHALAQVSESERDALHAMRARFFAEGADGDRALREIECVPTASGSIAASIETTRALIAHDRGSPTDALGHYDAAISSYAAVGNVLAAYLRFVRMIAALEAGRFAEARASAVAALADAPVAMAQLVPLVELARFVAHGELPSGALPEIDVVASSTRLVRAYIARARGDAHDVVTAVEANAPHERWSVTSRVLSRLAREGPIPPSSSVSRVLLVGPRGTWFAVPDGPQVSLATRPVLQRVLVALAHASPSIDVDAIAQAAWPGERIAQKAKRTRVHVAIATLRALGLRDHLAHDRARGYRLTTPVQEATAAGRREI